MNTKSNEKDYVSNLTSKEKKWLYTKPFGDFNQEESFLRIRDFSYIVELLKIKNKPNPSLLDLGCGSGWTSIFLAKLGMDVIGTDIAESMIGVAQERAGQEKVNLKFEVGDIEKNKYVGQFDRVLIYDALHHCSNEVKVLKNAYKSLKKGGMILIVEPNKAHQTDKEAQIIAKRFGVLEKGYTPGYLRKEMKKIGFKNIIRYHCNYGINKPVATGTKSFFTQVIRLISTRLVFSHYKSQVWMTAEK